MPTEAYECTLSGVLAGQFVQTVFHVNYINTGSQAPFFAAKDIADQMVAAGEFVAKFTDCLPTEYSCSSLRVRRVGPTGGPTAIVLRAAFDQADGQRAGNISSAQVNPLLILLPTVAPTKTGRIFLPGVSEDDIDSMSLVAGLVTAMETLGSYMVTGTTIAGGVVDFIVFRRATKLGDDLNATYVSPLIGTQRRRLHPI